MGLVFIDLKKAFDTVDHVMLLKILPTMVSNAGSFHGFNPTSPSANSFSRVNGVDSDTGDLEVGVPQGLCFGPYFS